MTTVELTNTNAHHALRISRQNRIRTPTTDNTPATPLPKRHTRAELEKIGNEVVMVPTRCKVQMPGMQKGVTRTTTVDVPRPFFQTAGYETLPQFCTETAERETREYEKAVAASAIAPRVQAFVDTWGPLEPLQVVPAGATDVVLVMSEEKRLVVECDNEAALSIAHKSPNRTVRLLNRDSASGAATHVTFLHPTRGGDAQSAWVTANGKSAAVLELLPT